MSYKTNYLNQGLINYVRKKNLDITKKEKIITPSSQKEIKNLKIYEKITDDIQKNKFLNQTKKSQG
jgi:hypothetical protein